MSDPWALDLLELIRRHHALAKERADDTMVSVMEGVHNGLALKDWDALLHEAEALFGKQLVSRVDAISKLVEK